MELGLIIGFAVFVVFLLFSGVKTVVQGFEYTVERFGKYRKTLSPGLHLIVPIVDKIGATVNMKEQVLDIPAQQVISQDNATVTIDAVCFFQVIDPIKATYEVNELPRAMQNLVQTNIRTVLGSMDLDWMLSKRDEINARILTIVDEATNPWGVKVTRIEIKDILPPRDLVDAMAKQMKAERLKRAQILDAEGTKQSEILEAEGMKQSSILRAEGEKEAAFREAEARERQAEAEANATQMVSKAIAEGNVQAINYFVAQKYVDALAKIATSDNQKVLMLPLEATSVIGSVAGIAEIAKESFAKK
ncbi:SPFH domain-containing protein [Kangiella koreensis]|uniref:Protein QmcA n=1 Tax=Kangiella koreensis (strain DSM 16069 / JCM 12317 / KCTC 12182 / SW-125) TaxID=523791 RepID=C7R8E2_KANKD|nr:SPFH domain-containing protein [Kangiella koreensis]ACV27707.1 band 7 protein [Kangiella koreensis DSM 16069]